MSTIPLAPSEQLPIFQQKFWSYEPESREPSVYHFSDSENGSQKPEPSPKSDIYEEDMDDRWEIEKDELCFGRHLFTASTGHLCIPGQSILTPLARSLNWASAGYRPGVLPCHPGSMPISIASRFLIPYSIDVSSGPHPGSRFHTRRGCATKCPSGFCRLG